jgi:hypothetical protein
LPITSHNLPIFRGPVVPASIIKRSVVIDPVRCLGRNCVDRDHCSWCAVEEVPDISIDVR